MPSFDLLNKPLEAPENPGLDTIDPRFQEIATLAQNGELDQASPKIEALFGENIYDIRLLGYYLYDCLIHSGMGKVLEFFNTLNGLLTENWAAVGPLKKRETHADKGLSWLFSQLEKHINLEEDNKGPEWDRWLKDSTSEMLGEAMEAADKFRRNLGMALEEKPPEKALEQLSKVISWLRDFQRTVYEIEEKNRPAEVSEEEETEEEGQKGPSGGGLGLGLGGSSGDGTMVDGSYHIQILQRKLKAFEILVQKEELAKASLVADDLAQIIANFDPTLYFPKMFSRYFALLSYKIEEISQFWGNKETLPWQVMEQLYNTDLDSFVDF